MARPKKTPAVDAPLVPSNSLVASAVRYSGGKAPRVHQVNSKGWQRECYRHYAICGEARFAARFFGHALSRVRLTVQREVDGTKKTVTDGSVYDLLEDLFNGKDGQAQMLEAIGIHLTVAGECYLIGRTVTERDDDGNIMSSDELWEVLSVLEVKVQGEAWSISYGDGYKDIPLSDDDVVIRIWSPNPAKRVEADSPFRALLPILSEIEWLTRSIFSQITSRLAGAGILFLPQGMTFPPPPEVDGVQAAANEADAFMLVLGDAMLKPLEDPENPASRVPIIVTAPENLIDKARLMTFWTELDAVSKDLRQEAIFRFAVGMDLPAEQVLGMSSNTGTGGGTSNGVSHWGAWQIEEATIKMHVEPMAETVRNALMVEYILAAEPNATDVLAYDSSNLRLRPDRSRESIELYQAGALKMAKMLEENGFDPKDAPDSDELTTFFLRKIATGSATPEQVEAALAMLGIELNSAQYGDLGQGETREVRPDPSIEDHPTRPRTPAESGVDPVLLAACEGLVLRALEKAGNRVLNAGKRGKDRDKTLDPLEAHLHERINGNGPALLDGAFSTARYALDGYDDVPGLTASLSGYCLDLFEHQQPYSRDTLAAWLGTTR